MAHVVFYMVREAGHMNPTYKLAHQLQARGHRVSYLAIPDFEAAVVSRGFEIIPFTPDLFPKGWLEHYESLDSAERERDVRPRFAEVSRRFLNGAFADIVRAIAPDVLLADIIMYSMPLIAWQLSIPCLRLSTSLPQTMDGALPPITSPLGPPRTVGDRLRSRLAWERRIWREWWTRNERRIRKLDDVPSYFPRLLAQTGYPASAVDLRTTFVPHFTRIPELVLAPPELDFARPPSSQRRWAPATLELDRKDDAPVPDLDDRPLVYCSLGSQVSRYPAAAQVLRSTIAAMSRRPDLQAVMVVGSRLTAERFAPIPENVKIVARAPQLRLLQRARVFITHGGLGSVKEAAYHGVPMIVFPQAFDQPGNGARVEHHRIGLLCRSMEPSADDVLALLERVLDDAPVTSGVAAMRDVMRRAEESLDGAQHVEAMVTAQIDGQAARAEAA